MLGTGKERSRGWMVKGQRLENCFEAAALDRLTVSYLA